MAVLVDMITGKDLVQLVTANIDGAIPATGLGIKAFVDLVLEKVKDRKMNALRIWGHGITHYSDDTDYPDGNVNFGTDNLNHKNVDSLQPTLERLAACFAPAARAELRGCQPAKGKGQEMMKRLAKIWNVEVHGSDRSQFLITWNPPVYVATPGGRFGTGQGIEVFEKR